MTSAPIIDTQASHEEVPESGPSPRLTLKPEAPVTGFVDGAWWPYSRDLHAELPALLRVLAATTGTGARAMRVERVSYNLATWGSTDREVDVDGLLVRLGGYRSQHTDTVDLISRNQRLTLLVVPPETGAEAARRALTTAAQAGNAGSIEHLLHGDPAPPTGSSVEDEPAEDEQRWDFEGGHSRPGG